MSIRYTQATLLSQSAAGAGTPIACDWRHSSVQQRRIFLSAITAPDTVLIEGSMDGLSWAPMAAALTATGGLLIEGPIAYLRATKTGTTATATVTGLV
jgi:hypothetical protein